MKIRTIGIATVIELSLLSLITSTRAHPSWLQPRQREQGLNEPRQYTAYEQATNVEHYSYGGYGPAPTVVNSASTKVLITSDADGEVTPLYEQFCK